MATGIETSPGRIMLIVCPSCVSSYRVDPAQLSDTRRARCAHCRAVFSVPAAPEPGRDLLAVIPAEAIGRAAPPMQGSTRPVHPLRSTTPPVRRERSATRIVVAAALTIGLGMGFFAVRERIVRAVPGAGDLWAAAGLGDAGLSVGEVRTAVTEEGATRVLTLQGTISNGPGGRAAVPDLRIVVRDGASQSLYTWTTPAPRSDLGPGETVTFRSRLVSPPTGGHDLVVGFAEPRGEARIVRVKDGK